MDTIGQTLKKARESRKLTVAAVAHAARAKIRYIEAIEADDFSVFPAPIYARGFIRLFAEGVGLNPQPLLEAHRRHEGTPAPAVKAPQKTRLADAGPEPKIGAADAASRRGGAPRPAAPGKILWSAIEDRCAALSAIRLPVETWKNILAVAGMALLALAAVAVLAVYFAGTRGAGSAAAARWLAEPPAPYLNLE